ncbi:MAG: (deoxy)nucleoside triphosphate pyrophosphohydrolase [Spirochaetales bacterium]|nr:(deoxy)nucleoside triphosphate pyrophosphohydrolase [Spirochaetales bacterium]
MQKVTAAVIVQNGKYLVAKRQAGGSLGKKWEFPGGKVEPGETPEQGLEREIKEEFAIKVKAKKFIGSHQFKNEDKEYELMAYFTDILSGTITLSVHDEIRWITIDEFDNFDFAESDRAIIKILKKTPDNFL